MLDALANLLGGVRIGWRDVLDIAVVAFLIYHVLRLMRQTRAVQIALGGAILIGVYFGSQVATLRTANWIVRDMLGYIVFVAIVLFQSDIRRALSNLGRARFVRYLSRPATAEETIDEVVTAAGALARRRIGAIIVIERDIGLRNYIESGIPLDSAVTYDLLISLFQPDAPLHDGAVILQENRIAAAACFLPLTVNPRLTTEFGTRHRAAIGLTEECDAVALVVSEETGTVSLALDGQLERSLDAERLRSRLLVLMPRAERRPAYRRERPEYEM